MRVIAAVFGAAGFGLMFAPGLASAQPNFTAPAIPTADIPAPGEGQGGGGGISGEAGVSISLGVPTKSVPSLPSDPQFPTLPEGDANPGTPGPIPAGPVSPAVTTPAVPEAAVPPSAIGVPATSGTTLPPAASDIASPAEVPNFVGGVPYPIPPLIPGAQPLSTDPAAPTTDAATPTKAGAIPASGNGANTEVGPVEAMESISGGDMVAVAGGVGGLMFAGVVAGGFTYRGASAQQRRIAAARAEFFGTGAQ